MKERGIDERYEGDYRGREIGEYEREKRGGTRGRKGRGGRRWYDYYRSTPVALHYHYGNNVIPHKFA